MKLIILIIFIFFAGCSNPTLTHAQRRYPNCQVTEVSSNSDTTTVSIKCPRQDPFQKTFRSNQ